MLVGSGIGGISVAWGFIGFVGLCIAGYFQIRSESSKQSKERVGDAKDETTHWRASFQAEQQRANGLAEELKEQRELKHSAMNELAGERLRRDLTPLMTLCTDSFKQMSSRFEQMDKRIEGVETRLNARMDAFLAASKAQTEALQAITKHLNSGGPK